MVAVAPTLAGWTLESAWTIPNGTPVHDVNGAKIGKVSDADIDALVVTQGRLFVQEVAIERDVPVERIGQRLR